MSKLTARQALKRGIVAHKAGRIQEATRIYTAILKTQPKHPDANHNMGLLSINIGKVEQALLFFKTALEADPAKVEFWLRYIDTLIRTKQFNIALSVVNEAKSYGVKSKGLHDLQAKILEATAKQKETKVNTENKKDKNITTIQSSGRQKDITSAKLNINYSTTLVDHNTFTDPPKDKLKLLSNLYKSEQFEEALELSNILIREFKSSPILFNIRGLIFQKLGELTLAVESYQKAVYLDQYYYQTWFKLGEVYHLAGRFEESINAYKKSIALKTVFPQAYFNLGNVYREAGKKQEALIAYDNALLQKPDFVEALHNKAVTLQTLGELKDALEHYWQALSFDQKIVGSYDNCLSLAIQLKFVNSIIDVGDRLQKLLGDNANNGPKSFILSAIYNFVNCKVDETKLFLCRFKELPENILRNLPDQDQKFCFNYFKFIQKLIRYGYSADFSNAVPIFHLGESHCLSFAYQKIASYNRNYVILPRIILGAKAFHFTGLSNNSYKSLAKSHLSSIPIGSTVLISFGEIDCRADEGFARIDHKSPKSTNQVIKETVKSYVDWFAQNNEFNLNLVFFNLPAPVYNSKFSAEQNHFVRSCVQRFNKELNT